MSKKTTRTHNEYRAYRERFEAVNALVIEELRRRSPEECLRQFHDLMTLAKAMNWEVHTSDETDAVRRRWQKLKGYGGKKEKA